MFPNWIQKENEAIQNCASISERLDLEVALEQKQKDFARKQSLSSASMLLFEAYKLLQNEARFNMAVLELALSIANYSEEI